MNIRKVIKDRYQILHKIGQGGMSEVFLCEDLFLHTNWAGKYILKDGSKDSKYAYKALSAETKMLAGLHHKSIPRIIDYVDNEDEYIVIMDFIRGVSLQQWLKNHQPSEQIIFDWAFEILHILHYLHTETIIFRDLKPANLLIDENEQLMLIDFGIAIYAPNGIVSSSPCYGTKGYASKEQSIPGIMDCRSDIYSFGATLFYMYTKQIYKKQKIPSVKLKSILIKCLQENPEKRYPDALSIIHEMENIKKWHSFITKPSISTMLCIVFIMLHLYAVKQQQRSIDDLYDQYLQKEEYTLAIDLKPSAKEAYLFFYDECKRQYSESEDALLYALQQMENLSFDSLPYAAQEELYMTFAFDCMKLKTTYYYRFASMYFHKVHREDMNIYIQISEFLSTHDDLSYEEIQQLEGLLNEIEGNATASAFGKYTLQLYEMMIDIYKKYTNDLGIFSYNEIIRIVEQAIQILPSLTASDQNVYFYEQLLVGYFDRAQFYDAQLQGTMAEHDYAQVLQIYDEYVKKGYVLSDYVLSKVEVSQRRLKDLKERESNATT